MIKILLQVDIKKMMLFYSRSGMWISSVPEGFKPVITAKEKDHFISGWWQENEQVAGQVLAIEGKI